MTAAPPVTGPRWPTVAAVPRPAAGVGGPPPVPNPQLRASTADRQRYADYLGQAYATGQLDDEELSSRLDAALGAKTMGDLAGVAADLNFAGMAVATPAAAAPSQAVVPVAPRRTHRVAKAVTIAAAVAIIVLGAGMGRAFNDHGWMGDQRGGPGPGPGAGMRVGNVGAQSFVFTSLDDLKGGVSVKAGSADIDLTGLDITRDADLNVTVGVGNATIHLPADGNVNVDYNVRVGNVDLNGGVGSRAGAGTGVSGTQRWTPNVGGPTLTVHVDVQMGNLQVG